MLKIGLYTGTHGLKGEIKILSNFSRKDLIFKPNVCIYINNKEYIINNSDISNSNPQEVYRSFGIDDDEMNQSLSTMFRV